MADVPSCTSFFPHFLLFVKIGTIVEQATSLDLQPAESASDASNARTLQLTYLCRVCVKKYKPVLEIIAILITGVFGVLAPLFAIAKMVAEW